MAVSYSQACRRYLHKMSIILFCSKLERVAHESPEESGIARSSFKAESNKGPAIPNGIDLADHLGSDVKKIARKDGDPTVRGTVPPTLKTKLKGNEKRPP